MAMKREVRELREALLDLTGILNRPQPDAALIEAAGVDLDRALFPLLARVERRGPLGIVELAELVGRDYTTVSRQIAKLESLGLIARCPSPEDGRVRAAVITDQGRAITTALDAARQKIVEGLLADWDKEDVRDLVRLLRRFADDALGWVKTL
ncbi:DNA-binding MarR family transcriptional regulator [Paraburkholderia sp. GAS33]|jgi:DNA-binding MarR family transcriptional regulator|uniref:DNA-binding transcriptional regulator, MarR family n=2 Tax=Burkholderiaceae TaxID=119060 RepID=A0A1N6JYG5_9BURK|nr:DNA-binding transcriptional regulator, MarR family [Paraburkholderia phenazinium]